MARARRARLPRRRQRLGQDDPARDAGGRARARTGRSCAAATTSRSATSPSTRRSPATTNATLLSHAQRATGLSEAKTRALLGRFLFSGDDVAKRLGDISGGEAQRLALALLTQSDANVLVLDEPTNHLDLESREALEDALTGFAGSLLLVSHDRALLEAVGIAHAGDRGRSADEPPGRLGRVPLLGRGRSGRRAPQAPASRSAAARPGPRARARTARQTWRGSSARSRRPRRTSGGSRTSSPTRRTGPILGARRARPRATRRARAKLDELIARWEAAAERVEG